MSKRGTTEADVRRQQFEAARRLIFGTDLIPGTNRERWTTAGRVPTVKRYFTIGNSQFTLGPYTFALASSQIDDSLKKLNVFLLLHDQFKFIAELEENCLSFGLYQYIDPIIRKMRSVEFWSDEMDIIRSPSQKVIFPENWRFSYHRGHFYFNVGFHRYMLSAFGAPIFLPKEIILPHQKSQLYNYANAHKNIQKVGIDLNLTYPELENPISILKLNYDEIPEGVVEFPEKKLTCVFQKGIHGLMYFAAGELDINQLFPNKKSDLCLFNYTDVKGLDECLLFSESGMKVVFDAIAWLMHVLTGPDPRNYAGPVRESDAPIKEESFPKPLEQFIFTLDEYGMKHMKLSRKSIFFLKMFEIPEFRLNFFTLDPRGLTVVQATTIRNTTMRFLQSTGDFPGALNNFLKGEGFDNQPYTLEEFQQAVDRITRFEQYEYLGSPMLPAAASLCAQCGTAAAPEQCSLCHKSAYCGRDCQAAHWPLHQSECVLVGGAYDFTDKALAWIRQRPLNAWRPETKELGDRNMEDDDYLLLQRSRNAHGLGLTIQVLGIREQFRRQGHSMQLLARIEETARAHGLRYVLIQSVMGAEMEQLARKAGFTRVDNGGADFIKLL